MKTRTAALMVTRRCNMKCGHCSVESHPKIKAQPDEAELHRIVDDLVKAGIKAIQFTGGEPMLRGPLILELMRRAQAGGVASGLVSNGFWGKKSDVAARTLDELRAAGMTRLALSYDRFHAEFQGSEPLLNILAAARALDWPIHINITRALDDKELDQIVAPFQNQSHARLRFYDIQPVGAAKSLDEELRAQLSGFCSACEQLTITDNGRAIACNGPAYFEPAHSGLVVGEVRSGKTSIAELLALHSNDPILKAIRTGGPTLLRRELETIPGFESFPFRESYSGMCELCLDINRDAGAVAALRERLGDPQKTAELLGRQLVREAYRSGAAKGIGVQGQTPAAGYLKVLAGSREMGLERILGRADLDWQSQAAMLKEAGLFHLFADEDRYDVLQRWMPSFFGSEIAAYDTQARRTLRLARADLDKVASIALKLGIGARAQGSTLLVGATDARVPSTLHIVSDGDATLLRRELEAASSSKLPWAVIQTSEMLDEKALTPELIAVEVLREWAQARFRGAVGAAWDLHQLTTSDDFNTGKMLAQARALGLERLVAVASDVLSSELGVLGIAGHEKLVVDWRSRALARVARSQMSLPQWRRENLFISAVLPILAVSSLAGSGGAMRSGVAYLLSAVRGNLKTEGLAKTLNRVAADAAEMLGHARTLL